MASAGAAAAAAARRRLEQEEEEEVTMLNFDPSSPYEYKIIRSATGAFRNPAKFQAFLEEEARAGWELLEKLDDTRARLKRPIEWRTKDGGLEQDPYRTKVGAGEATIVAWVLLATFLGIGAAIGTAVLLSR
jgi:hypothetical protein